jgi:hypothetical protein
MKPATMAAAAGLGSAGAVDEGGDPAPFAGQRAQRPFVDHQRRRGAEADHVGQAVVLGAEFGLGVGHTRHAAVEAVQHHGHENGPGRQFEAQIHRLHDGVEAAEQRCGGEGVRQQVDAARADRIALGVEFAAADAFEAAETRDFPVFRLRLIAGLSAFGEGGHKFPFQVGVAKLMPLIIVGGPAT